MRETLAPAPATTDAEGLALLARALRDADYTAPVVHEALGAEGTFNRDPDELPLYLRLLDRSTALAALIELFLLGVDVDEERADRSLAPVGAARLEAMGVLQRSDGTLRSTIHLAPTEDLLLASDRADEEIAPPEHVLGLSPPTRVLACLTVRPPVETALDLGTGFGLQAIVAASHTGRVVATDISARALRFAEFNAILNGVANVELREGSLFEPVEGETFDLIVANPPYVISPEMEYVYRDSGLPGDTFCEGLVRSMPAYLNEGGFGQALVAWAHDPEAHWADPLRRWVAGSGCDALLFHYVSHDTLSYAAGWNRPLRSQQEAYAEALDRWTAYYRELGIRAIAWGAVVLRKRSGGDNWVWAHNPSAQRIGPASHHIVRLFGAQDLLHELPGDAGLLDERLVLADDHRLEQSVVLGGGEGAVVGAVLRLEGGIRSQVAVDANTVQLISRLDGGRTVGELLAEAGEEGVTAAALPAVRRLLELGFLVRA